MNYEILSILQSWMETLIKARHYLILALAALLPLAPRALPILIVSFCFIHVIILLKTRSFQLNKDLWVWVLPAFYLWHFIGMFYTSNWDSGLFDLEVKLSLLIMPLLFLNSKNINMPSLTRTMRVFLLGMAISFLVCFAYSSYGYYNNSLDKWPAFISKMAHFYGVNFSFILHPGYYAIYLNLAILFLWYLADKGQLKLLNKWYYPLLVVFMLSIYFTASKSGIGVLLFLLVVRGIWVVVKYNSIKTWLVTALCVVLFGTFMYTIGQHGHTYYRIKAGITDVLSSEVKPNTSTGIRKGIWQVSTSILSDNWIVGVGTGDVKDVMAPQLLEMGFTKAVNAQMNQHNQFLQTAVALGIVGFSLLILVFIGIIKNLREWESGILILFPVIMALAFLTESFIEVQAGIIFFAFFHSILLSNKQKTI